MRRPARGSRTQRLRRLIAWAVSCATAVPAEILRDTRVVAASGSCASDASESSPDAGASRSTLVAGPLEPVDVVHVRSGRDERDRAQAAGAQVVDPPVQRRPARGVPRALDDRGPGEILYLLADVDFHEAVPACLPIRQRVDLRAMQPV